MPGRSTLARGDARGIGHSSAPAAEASVRLVGRRTRRAGCARRPLGDDVGDARRCRLRRDADGVLHHPRLGTPVGHDAHPAHPEQRCAAVALVVEALPDAVESGLEGEERQRRDRPLLQVGAQRAEDVAGQPLEELDHHVAHEAVADDHVGAVRDHLVGLHVADEVEVCRRQALVGGARQDVALLHLLADVEEADARIASRAARARRRSRPWPRTGPGWWRCCRRWRRRPGS